MKQVLCIAAFMAACLSIQAQTFIRGRVTDATTNTALAGATITYAGKKSITNNDGSFSLECGEALVFTISYVGYLTSQKRIKSCDDEFLISLESSARSLENIEITATSNQNKSLLYQPSSITKLSQVELKRGMGLFLDDAIVQNVPGVTMNRRTVSGGQQFNIRGYGNGSRGTRGVSSNFDGQGYKVYLNGIPVTDAEGITTLDDIDYGSIGNAEVVKGASGTLYGLAIAGVVNLKTIKPEKGKTSVSQEVLVGDYDLQRYTTQFSTTGEHSSLLLNYGHQKSQGYTIHNDSKKNFVNAIAEFTPNDKQTITAYFGYSNSYDQRSGELTIAQFESGDYSGNIEYIKRNGHSNVYTFRAGVGHSYQFNNAISNTTTIFGTSFTSNASSAGGWTDKLSLNVGLRSTFDTKIFIGNNTTLSGITGIETQRQNAQTVGYTMIKNPLDQASSWQYGNPYYWVIGASTSNVYGTSSTSSLFTEWTLGLPKDLSITAGIGWSNQVLSLADRFYNAAQPNKPTHFDTTYKPGLSPHIAINKVFSKQFSLYASYNRAYKAPVSSYFYIPYALNNNETGVVNKHLKPEVGDQFEVGTKGSLLNGKLTYQVALFDAMYKSKFTTISVPNQQATATFYSYVTNGGKQDNRGVEALLKTNLYQSTTGFFSSISPFANVTYSDFQYKDYKFQPIVGAAPQTYDYSGHQVAGVSKWVGSVGTDFLTRPGIYGNVAYTYRDAFPLTSLGTADGTTNTPEYHVSSWSLLNAKLGYRCGLSHHFNLDVYAAANNITGSKYPIMVFVNQIPDAYIAGPNKAVYFGGVNVKYNF
ncbi:MAG: TonB-dependent receptor [Bacteroidota bacterium]|nr:TonB-dependent receptor [Bacteroidota bacterium]